MRSATAATTTTFTAIAVTLVLLLLPGSAFAVDGVPDEMVDPVGAMEPEIAVAEPAADTPVAAGVADARPQGEPARPDATATAVRGTAAAPTWTPPAGAGTLPFTGPAPGLLTLLFLVGALALSAGAVAYGYARAMSEAA